MHGHMNVKFNKQVWIEPDQLITQTAVRDVNHAILLLSSTFLCMITQTIQMSTDQKKNSNDLGIMEPVLQTECLKTTLIKENKRQANIPPSSNEHILSLMPNRQTDRQTIVLTQPLTCSTANIH
jgi:hypothetical protein